MAKKKSKTNPPKPVAFRSTPFSSLKGVTVAVPPLPAPPRPPVAKVVEATDDGALFLTAMDDVRRLDERKSPQKQAAHKRKPDVASPPVGDRQREIERIDEEVFSQAIGRLKLDVTFNDRFPDDEELKPMGVNRLRQMKRGAISVDRQLDLHGLSRDEALAALPRFLQSASAHGEKAVLVITGKGNNSPGEPVLLQAVTGWLRDAGKKLVVEFAPAPREMGGGGAFVVFLRDQKN